MQRIYYDSYEKKIRKTVWAEINKTGAINIHRYVLGVYIDDIFGKDEHENVITVTASDKDGLYKILNAGNDRDFFDKSQQMFNGRDCFEQFESFLRKNNIIYSEKSLY